MEQRIVGPFAGKFIATLAYPMGDLGERFMAQFRLLEERPATFFSRTPGKVRCIDQLFENAASACEMAIEMGKLQILVGQGQQPDDTQAQRSKRVARNQPSAYQRGRAHVLRQTLRAIA